MYYDRICYYIYQETRFIHGMHVRDYAYGMK